MKCGPKTMAIVVAMVLAVLAIAYFASPAARALIVAFAPILLALICPVTMIAMMLTMRDHGASAPDAAPRAAVSPPRKTPDVVQEA